MRLSGWLLVGVLLAGSVGGFVAWRRHTEPARAWAELLDLEGVDLRTLTGSAKTRAATLFDRFADLAPPGIRSGPCGPWAVLKLVDRVVLLTTVDLGRDQVVWVWDEDGRNVDSGVWSWGGKLESVRTVFRPEVDAWCIETVVAASGTRVRHFRLFMDGYFALVRVEDEQGNGRALPREFRVITMAGSGAEWTDWLAGLKGNHILHCLGWMRTDTDWKADLEHPPLRAALEKLRMSTNPWIRETAELALRP